MTNDEKRNMLEDAQSHIAKAHNSMRTAARLTATAMGGKSRSSSEADDAQKAVTSCHKWFASLLDGWQ